MHKNPHALTSGRLFAKIFFSTKYTSRSLFIRVTFRLQQQMLIAAANVTLTAIFTSLNCVKEGKVLSSLSLALLPKMTLDSVFYVW